MARTRFVSSSKCLLAMASLLLIIIAITTEAVPSSDSSEAPSTGNAKIGQTMDGDGGRANFKLPKLFDFGNFKQQFRKSYSNFLEETVRQKYFLSRAFRAFVSALKYIYRKSKFYLAINFMSDATPEELDKQRNKVLEKEFAARLTKVQPIASGRDDPLPFQLMPMGSSESFVKELNELVRKHVNEPGFKELAKEMTIEANERRRRDVTSEQATTIRNQSLRILPLDRLINTGAEGVQLSPEAVKKFKLRTTQRNPLNEPIMLPSRGLIDQQVNVTVSYVHDQKSYDLWLERAQRERNHMEIYLDNELQVPSTSSFAQTGEIKLPNEVFVDWRDSNCLLPPRYQGLCGSCYAFAAITMMEWLHCMAFNELVPFSEQYIVDCSKYVGRLDGCSGGQMLGLAKFLHNFGLEMNANYPYNAQVNECPYDEQTDLRTTGYYRAEIGNLMRVPLEFLAQYLAYGPMWVVVYAEKSFNEYGGGLHGWGCKVLVRPHAMVLIGHGREDNTEYWLLRNSYSTGWGEQGHYKLAKDANCLDYSGAFIFGSKDGVSYPFKFAKNAYNAYAKRHSPVPVPVPVPNSSP